MPSGPGLVLGNCLVYAVGGVDPRRELDLEAWLTCTVGPDIRTDIGDRHPGPTGHGVSGLAGATVTTRET